MTLGKLNKSLGARISFAPMAEQRRLRQCVCVMNAPIYCFVAAALVSCAAAGALDEQIESRLIGISHLPDDKQRLAAYDALAGELAHADPLSPQHIGSWSVSRDVSPLDDSTIIVAKTSANAATRDGEEQGSLICRLKEGRFEIYISQPQYLGSESVPVEYRINDRAVAVAEWTSSTDKKALFFPGDHTELAAALCEGHRFVARFTPYSETPRTYVFDTTGLNEVLAEMRLRKSEPEIRIWTSMDGRTTLGEFLSSTATHVKFRRVSDGSVFEYELAKLSLEDREWVKQRSSQ